MLHWWDVNHKQGWNIVATLVYGSGDDYYWNKFCNLSYLSYSYSRTLCIYPNFANSMATPVPLKQNFAHKDEHNAVNSQDEAWRSQISYIIQNWFWRRDHAVLGICWTVVLYIIECCPSYDDKWYSCNYNTQMSLSRSSLKYDDKHYKTTSHNYKYGQDCCL